MKCVFPEQGGRETAQRPFAVHLGRAEHGHVLQCAKPGPALLSAPWDAQHCKRRGGELPGAQGGGARVRAVPWRCGALGSAVPARCPAEAARAAHPAHSEHPAWRARVAPCAAQPVSSAN